MEEGTTENGEAIDIMFNMRRELTSFRLVGFGSPLSNSRRFAPLAPEQRGWYDRCRDSLRTSGRG